MSKIKVWFGRSREWLRQHGFSAMLAAALGIVLLMQHCQGQAQKDLAKSVVTLEDQVKAFEGRADGLAKDFRDLNAEVDRLAANQPAGETRVVHVRDSDGGTTTVVQRDPRVDGLAREVAEAKRDAGQALARTGQLGDRLELLTGRVDDIDKPDGKLKKIDDHLEAIDDKLAKGCQLVVRKLPPGSHVRVTSEAPPQAGQ